MSSSLSKTVMQSLYVVIGLALIALAVFYWRTPAQALPGWLPGFDPSSTKIHLKHGIGSFILGLGAFVLAWFRAGARSTKI